MWHSPESNAGDAADGRQVMPSARLGTLQPKIRCHRLSCSNIPPGEASYRHVGAGGGGAAAGAADSGRAATFGGSAA